MTRGQIEAERLRANAVEVGLGGPALDRAIEAWAHALDVETPDAYAVAADALEEVGAPNAAAGARWLASAGTLLAVEAERTGHQVSGGQPK